MRKNYLRARGLPWRAYYFYLDKRPWLADRIFSNHGLRVHFGDSFVYREGEYELVSCWVYRWQAEEFEKCMLPLSRSSLLHDRSDYDDVCRELAWLFERESGGDDYGGKGIQT